LIDYYQGYSGFGSCHAGTCSASGTASEPRRFGDYQYFMSFGGDQFYNIPQIMENVFGVLGIVIHVSHFIAGQVFELTGYTTFGEYTYVFMYVACRLLSIKTIKKVLEL
jgi:hypothetical protein